MDTRGEQTGANRVPQQSDEQPPQWRSDLNPDHLAGQNVGQPLPDREIAVPTAFDVKAVHRALGDFNDEDLKQIPILAVGTRLQQGATYVDLADAKREEFRANGAIAVGQDQYVVPKDRVPYWIWNRLIHEEKPGQE